MAQIIWTEPALEDLEAIADYIALDKPRAARRLVQRVMLRIEQLALFPKSGGRPRELAGTPYRQLVIPPLKIYYRLEEETVWIIHVMRGERPLRPGEIKGREQG